MDGGDIILELATDKHGDVGADAVALNILGDLSDYWTQEDELDGDDFVLALQWLINTNCRGSTLVKRYHNMALADVPGLAHLLVRKSRAYQRRMQEALSELSDTQRQLYDAEPCNTSLTFLGEMKAWLADHDFFVAGASSSATTSAVLDTLIDFLSASIGPARPNDDDEPTAPPTRLSLLMESREQGCDGDMDVFMRKWIDANNARFMTEKATHVARFCDNLVDGLPDSTPLPPDVEVASEFYFWMSKRKIDRSLRNRPTSFAQTWIYLARSLLQWYTKNEEAASMRALLLTRLCAYGLEAQTALWSYFAADGGRRLEVYPHNFTQLGIAAKLETLRKYKRKRRLSNTDQREAIRVYLNLALLMDIKGVRGILDTSKSVWETDAHRNTKPPELSRAISDP